MPWGIHAKELRGSEHVGFFEITRLDSPPAGETSAAWPTELDGLKVEDQICRANGVEEAMAIREERRVRTMVVLQSWRKGLTPAERLAYLDGASGPTLTAADQTLTGARV